MNPSRPFLPNLTSRPQKSPKTVSPQFWPEVAPPWAELGYLLLLPRPSPAAASLSDQHQQEDCAHQPHSAPETENSTLQRDGVMTCIFYLNLLQPSIAIISRTGHSSTSWLIWLWMETSCSALAVSVGGDWLDWGAAGLVLSDLLPSVLLRSMMRTRTQTFIFIYNIIWKITWAWWISRSTAYNVICLHQLSELLISVTALCISLKGWRK